MKSGLFHSKRKVIFLLPVLFLISISILSAQKKFIGTSIPESAGYINNFLGSFPESRMPEIPVWSHPEVHADSENFVKRDSVYTYAFISANDSLLHQKRIFFYNNNGQMVSSIVSLWNKREQLWADKGKMGYTYDENGFTTSLSYYKYLDSGIWQINTRYEFAYDSAGKLLMNAFYFNDTYTGEMRGFCKSVYSYYSNGLIKSNSSFSWDLNNKIWINRSHSEYTYNEKALLETRIISIGDESGSNWIPYRKQEFRYNDAGKYNSGQAYSYSTGNEEWTLSSRDSAFYDTLNHVSEFVFYAMNSTQTEWDYSSKYVKTCLSGEENHCVSIYYSWNADENDWVLTGDSYKDVRNKVLLTSGGFWQLSFTYDWDSIFARWKLHFGDTQSYNSAGHRTSLTRYTSAIINSDTLIVPYFHDTAFYNQNGSLLWKASYDNWNADLSEWETGKKTEYYYNENLQLIYSSSGKMIYPGDWVRDSSSVYYYSDFEPPENKIYSSNDTLFAVPGNAGSYQWFDCQSGEEVEDANKNWFYSGISGTYGVRIIKDNYILSPSCFDLAVAINNPENGLFRCYPNPSKGDLYLEFYQTDFSELKGTITNLAGVHVKTFLIPGNSSLIRLDLSGLSSGIYILRIRKGNQIIQTRKVSVVNGH